MGFNFVHIFENQVDMKTFVKYLYIKFYGYSLTLRTYRVLAFRFLPFFLVLRLNQIAYGWKFRTLSILFLLNLRNWIKIKIVIEKKLCHLSILLIPIFLFVMERWEANQNYF